LATNNNKFLVKNGLAVGSAIDVINTSGEWIGATGTLHGATGPQGATGVQGIDGASGYVGSDGATGIQGIDGATGPTGATGATGIQGASGSTGLTGATGPQGIGGATGPEGVQGIQGVEGASGITGASGVQGNIGATGEQGIQGASGTQGASGSTGLTGATGLGATGLTGATGTQGPSGQSSSYYNYTSKTNQQSGDPGTGTIIWNNATLLSSTQINVSHITGSSVDIDIFLAIVNLNDILVIQEANDSNRFQKWQVNGTPVMQTGYVQFPVTLLDSGGTAIGNNNPVILAIVSTPVDGATGSTGPQGATGITGASGVDGASGIQGASGSIGLNGATGTAGTNGATGTAGTNGATGPEGVQGIQGIQGASGATGTAGSNGVNGATGPAGASGVAAGAATGATGFLGAVYATNQVLIGATGWISTASPLGSTGSLMVAGPMAAAGNIWTPQILVGNYGYTGSGATGATGTIIANNLRLVSGGFGSAITFSDGTSLGTGTPSGFINGPISGFTLLIGATGAYTTQGGASGVGWFGNQIYVGPQGATGIQLGATGSIRNEGQINTGALHVGTWGATSALGATGEIRATNNVTAYFASDKSLKENVRDIPNALEKVMKIGGKLYDWTDTYIKSHGGEDAYFLRKSDFGVIAQDVQEVFPIAVRTREDGTLAVDYEKLCALAFAAIKELNDKIDSK